MDLVKSIIVVADEKLYENAMLLCHLLSREGNVKAAYWDYKEYRERANNVSSRMHYIFLGENKDTELITMLVANWTEDQGVRIGYDYRKGFIQQCGKPTDLELLIEVIKNSSKGTVALYALFTYLFPWAGGATIVAKLLKDFFDIKDESKNKSANELKEKIDHVLEEELKIELKKELKSGLDNEDIDFRKSQYYYGSLKFVEVFLDDFLKN